ncbi:hypothetical protein MKX01_022425 [Papaver californicum]|nr:hypothetical protein MKX01_022425 [Papaver californicum]
MEAEVIISNILLPQHLSFKRVQVSEKYPKGQARGKHWKHLKQILQGENYQICSPDEPTLNILFDQENCVVLVRFITRSIRM